MKTVVEGQARIGGVRSDSDEVEARGWAKASGRKGRKTVKKVDFCIVTSSGWIEIEVCRGFSREKGERKRDEQVYMKSENKSFHSCPHQFIVILVFKLSNVHVTCIDKGA